MHSPGQSSAASITSSNRSSAKEAKPAAPSGFPTEEANILSPSRTYAKPSGIIVNTSGAISAHNPSPVHKSWSIQTLMVRSISFLRYNGNMPQYNYRCSNGHLYEEFRPILEEQRKKNCPECNAELKQRYSPPGIQLNGHGFYRNTR